jgi:hypothetical protein
VSSEGNLVKTYQFNYGYDYLYSMLKEVVETAYDGSSLNSTIFLYGDQQAPSLEYVTSDVLEGKYDFFSGDFNADGKTDLLAANAYYSDGVKLHSGYKLLTNLTQSSAAVLYMKDLDAENASTSTSVAPSGSFSNFLTSDYNGDGRDDVMHVRTSKPGSAREIIMLPLIIPAATMEAPAGQIIMQLIMGCHLPAVFSINIFPITAILYFRAISMAMETRIISYYWVEIKHRGILR